MITDLANKRASAERMVLMDGMTNEQFKTVLDLIIQIIKDSKDKDEAIDKITALINKE